MIRALVTIVIAGVLFVGGWVFGAFVPVPVTLTDKVKTETEQLLAFANVSATDLKALRERLSAEDFQKVADNAASLAASSGRAVIVERAPKDTVIEDESGFTLASTEPAKIAPPSSGVGPAPASSAFENAKVCGGMTVSNKPPADATGLVLKGATTFTVEGVTLALNPTRGGACFASGFGQRGSRLHKGIDYYSPTGGDILAAAAGTVIEKKYRDDYGNMLVIDHGNGVFTRYAHLSSFDPAVELGGKVTAGQQLGLMGNTAGYRIPVHLHYELLTGTYALPAGSFGLQPRSPFEFAKAG